MVTEAILRVIGGIVSTIIGAFPHPALPDWLGAVPAWLPTAITTANEMGAWFPLDAIRNSAALLLLLWGVALAIRIIRIGLSFITLGGGSAA
jgi:hypothetical protein